MMYDIAALQHLYGADFTANAGDTTYAWSPTTGASFVNGARAVAPGGNRIFDDHLGRRRHRHLRRSPTTRPASGSTSRPARASTLSTAQSADLGGGPNGGIARGNVYNALQYRGDPRSLIENAVGGPGNDTIIGNAARNALTATAGNGSDVAHAAAGAPTASTAAPGPTCSSAARAATCSSSAPAAAPTRDAIRGFDGPGAAVGDLIDLSPLDASRSRGGDQDFILGGDAVGHLWITEIGSNTAGAREHRRQYRARVRDADRGRRDPFHGLRRRGLRRPRLSLHTGSGCIDRAPNRGEARLDAGSSAAARERGGRRGSGITVGWMSARACQGRQARADCHCQIREVSAAPLRSSPGPKEVYQARRRIR